MTDLPHPVADLVNVLAAMPGAVAVALGGSRALGTGDAGSDWDLGLYYRGTIDLAPLTARGTVHPPGAWGRLMNGGAWLRCGGEKVDVILRDLDAVEHWTRRCTRPAGHDDFPMVPAHSDPSAGERIVRPAEGTGDRRAWRNEP